VAVYTGFALEEFSVTILQTGTGMLSVLAGKLSKVFAMLLLHPDTTM
jgi:hypothetical protein